MTMSKPIELLLTRIRKDKERGVFGMLYIGTEFFCSTIERPDLNDDGIPGNEKGLSCIPAGTYTCKRSWYHKGRYETLEVTGVPGRDRILFHTGNSAKDVQGCIAVGQATDDDFWVKNSKITFRAFMEKLNGVDSFILTIHDGARPGLHIA